MIKAILLDFGGVLSGDANSWDTMYKRIPKSTGLTSVELENIFREHWIDVSIGKKDLQHILKDIIKQSRNRITEEELNDIYREDTKIYEDILSEFKHLREKGIKIIILSNESKTGERLRLNKVKEYVDKIYSSASLGLRKPDPRIYLKVLNDEKLNKEDVVFIDDKERNINAAKDLGISSIVYENLEQLREELKPYLN